MNNITIQKILEANPQTARVFKGCSPCDLLPDPLTLEYPAAFIVNLDSHELDGSHWVGVYAYGKKRDVYYFDSLALPLNDTIKNTFLFKFPKFIANTIAFQNPLSNACAHYCICFVYFLSIGYTFEQFLDMLSNCNNTDLFVRYIVNKIIG